MVVGEIELDDRGELVDTFAHMNDLVVLEIDDLQGSERDGTGPGVGDWRQQRGIGERIAELDRKRIETEVAEDRLTAVGLV